MLSKLERWLAAKGWGILLLTGSLVLTVILAVRSSSPDPPTQLESWLLALFAAGLQVGAGVNFARVGKADPTHARSSVRHLQALGRNAHAARLIAERALDKTRNANSDRVVIGNLSVYLSFIEESASLAVADWREFHFDAVEEVLHSNKEGEA